MLVSVVLCGLLSTRVPQKAVETMTAAYSIEEQHTAAAYSIQLAYYLARVRRAVGTRFGNAVGVPALMQASASTFNVQCGTLMLSR